MATNGCLIKLSEFLAINHKLPTILDEIQTSIIIKPYVIYSMVKLNTLFTEDAVFSLVQFPDLPIFQKFMWGIELQLWTMREGLVKICKSAPFFAFKIRNGLYMKKLFLVTGISSWRKLFVFDSSLQLVSFFILPRLAVEYQHYFWNNDKFEHFYIPKQIHKFPSL